MDRKERHEMNDDTRQEATGCQDEDGTVWIEDDSTHFSFIIPVYNCADTVAQTLLSLLAQSYEHWSAEIRDDLSTDETVEQVTRFIRAFGLEGKMRLVINTEKHGEVRNTLEAAKSIGPDEVICRLDGGDWLTDNDGLAMLDAAYRHYGDDLAVLWTKHRWGFSTKNISAPLDDENEDVYQEVDNWRVSHLKTWKRWAMDGINDANYRDASGRYIMNACDRAIILPILHKARLAGKKRVYLPHCMYHYTIDDRPETYQTDRAKAQRRMAEFIHKRGFIE